MTAVIEGEVVDGLSSTFRRRERNALRTPDVLPPDVDTKVVALRQLPSVEMQAAAVTAMLSHSRTGLLAAIASQDLPQIVEWKQKAAAIQEIAKQVRLGKDLLLDAAEFVRRAERGLAGAIREGQRRGEITSHGLRMNYGNQHGCIAGQNGDSVLSSPYDFADKQEINPGSGGTSIYKLVDDVPDESFTEALTAARAEGNLSRANVARKAKAKASESVAVDANDPLIDAEVEPQPEPVKPKKSKKRLTKHNSTEMLANINGMLNGIVETLPFIDPADVNFTDNYLVITNIRHSMGRIRKLLREIENG